MLAERLLPFRDLHSLTGDRVLSIRGREVISERECTRDAEWKLLHITLQRSSSCQQASVLPWLPYTSTLTLQVSCRFSFAIECVSHRYPA